MNVSSVNSMSTQIGPRQVSASALKAAVRDGDGRTGVAALNDGDAAAHGAARTVQSQSSVDIKA